MGIFKFEFKKMNKHTIFKGTVNYQLNKLQRMCVAIYSSVREKKYIVTIATTKSHSVCVLPL